MLALGTTPVMAQSAPAQTPSASDPIVLQSPVAPPAATPNPAPTTAAPVAAPRTTQSTAPTQPAPQQPAIVLDVPPAPVAETQREAAPVSNERATAAAPAAEPRPASRERAVPDRAASNDAAPVAASADAPVSSTADDALLAEPTVAPAPFAATAPEAVAAEPAPAGAGPDWVAIISLALAGLIPLGAIAFALVWFRRRSRRVDALESEAYDEVEYVEEPAAEPVQAPLADRVAEPVTPSLAFDPEPVPVVTTPATTAPRENPMDGYQGLPNKGAAVSLPAELPKSFEERDALLKRMIEAEPDRANPFRSGKARARRARLILQSLGRTFENVKPRFDLSQYTRNWPALAGRRTSFA
ncbi:hypothetical protein [Pelagerythrobacter sp.]|uniref:hypothetical protein n=1 Tax=Pelagerythrobacter sp. TaxID=2800702 RepID=UPI0035B1282D